MFTMTQLSDESLRFGEELASITLGIDALDRRLNNYEDFVKGLVVINMGWNRINQYESYEEARAALAELAKKSFTLPEPDRRLYFLQACVSLDSFCTYKMGKLPALTDQVRLFLHSDCAPVSDAYLQAQCAKAKELLEGMGYKGSLKEMADEWEAENFVPADKVKDTMLSLIKEARKATGELLPLPEKDYTCEVTSGVIGWSARSDYNNLRVIVNIDPRYTLQALKHLVGHETYPGHYMQFTLRREYFEKGYGSADGLLSVCNHSSSSTFEGIADMGQRLMGWIKDDNDKVYEVLGDIKTALNTVAPFQAHVMHKSKDEIRNYLKQWPILGGDQAVESRLRFVDDPTGAALIWSYWRGDLAVSAVMDRLQPGDLDRYLDYIYGRLHTPASLQMFR